jgi:nucleotide-binding universal stress UspA family protein
MVAIERILCPIDFSDASRHALEHAVAFAKWYESQITALYVYQSEFFLEPPILFAERSHGPKSEAAERQSRQEELRRWLEPAAAAGVKTDVHVGEGSPVSSILEQASSMTADLIVMGTHGRGGFDRAMLGSVTEKVLRKARCPVLTVPPADVAVGKIPYTRLLCPLDFSEPSLAALELALSLAEESDAQLTLLHVFDWPPDDELLVERFDAATLHRVLEQPALGRLEALVPEEARVWCKPTTKVAYGKPYRKILEVAATDASDLIVIGVHGRNALDLTLFGSTTNQVVRRASCPVLTLRR